jgi:Gpi18-like mannosyltransferase
MQISKDFRTIVIYAIIFFIGCYFVPNSYIWGNNDRNCWITWSNYINHFGIQNIYKLEVDYPPLWHYFLWFFSKIYSSPESVYLKVFHLKYLVLFVEIVSVFFVYKILDLRNLKHSMWLPLLVLGNIAFWYNNFLFGQMDGVHTGFAFISITFALLRKPIVSLLFLVLCINFKFQGIIFLPLICLILFDEVKKYSFSMILATLLPAVFLQMLIFLPFILSGDLKLAINSFTDSVGRYPYVSMGAYNVWWLIFKNPQLLHDGFGIFNLSYNSYGLMVFFSLSGFVLLPFVLKCLNIFRKHIDVAFNFENVLLTIVLIILFFFYFNTQMHSRYSHPLVLFAGSLAMLRKDIVRFSLVSLAIFLNMEGESKILKGNIAEFETFWFQPWFVSLIFLTVTILYFYDYIILIKNSMTPKV